MQNELMTAAVFHQPENIVIGKVPVPQLSKDEVLVSVRAAAICGTDIRIYLGKKTKGVRLPSILGHEISGEIVETGTSIQGYKAGDRVIIAPVIACGQCYYCKHGLSNVCTNRTAFGYEYDGGFAEYIKLPYQAIQAGNLIHLPENISYEEGCIIEPLSCCIRSHRKMPIDIDEKVLVVGAGPIGLMHVKLLKRIGVNLIVVSEPNTERRILAQETGADIVVNPLETDLENMIKKETNGLGIDKIIVATSVPKVIHELMHCLRKGGQICLFAGMGAKVEQFDVDLIHYNELSICGTSAARIEDFQTAIQYITNNEISIKDLITKKFHLEQIELAINYVMSGNGLKTLLTI